MNPAWPNYPTPKATRDYDGLEFRLRRRFANRWSAEVDYTYSRLWGNYGGLASSDQNGAVTPNIGEDRFAPVVSISQYRQLVRSAPFGAVSRMRFSRLLNQYCWSCPLQQCSARSPYSTTASAGGFAAFLRNASIR
jgi:hypothetical protein